MSIEQEANDWADEAEAYRDRCTEARMFGFDDPDDPKYLEAVADYERYMDARDREYEIEEQTGARKCPECGNYSCESHVVNERVDPTVMLVCHDPYCEKVSM